MTWLNKNRLGRIDRLWYEDPQCQVLHTCQSHQPPICRAPWDYVRLCERPLQADWGSKSLTSITINNFQPGLFFFTAAIQVNELCLFFKLVKSSIGKLKMKGNLKFESGALRTTLPRFFLFRRSPANHLVASQHDCHLPVSIPFSKYREYFPSLVCIRTLLNKAVISHLCNDGLKHRGGINTTCTPRSMKVKGNYAEWLS